MPKKKKFQLNANVWVMLFLGMAIGFLVGWFLFGFVGIAKADERPAKIYWCHVPREGKAVTLHLPRQALIKAGHMYANGSPKHRGDYRGKCEKPEPTPTPTPPVCETENWSCEACQNDPREYEKRLGVCFEPFMQSCNVNYGCEFVGECDAKTLKECKSEWVCKDTCEEPTPTPSPEPTPEPKKPEGCTTNCNPPAPVCSAEAVVKEPANPHVYRQGGTALVKWNPTGGNKANIYYKECSADGWQHSTQTDNTGYVEIHELGNMDVCFAIEQVNDCGGGVITSARSHEIVDGATSGWVLFQ